MTSKPIYAFIDSQNLNLGVKSQGWSLDWRKFRQYLKNKYNVVNAYLFIGFKPGNQQLYTQLQKSGFIVVFKPTMELPGGVVKGNVDAELVLHTMIEFEKFSKAIIVSGDGDFFCLVEYLAQKNKLLHLLTPNKFYSKLYKPYSGYIIQADWIKNSVIKT
ncbi:MAG: NYN domain-containing protein [Candidatus Shapirobacteria bacterium]